MKVCNTCKNPKELTEYYKCSSCKDGLRGSCKQCVSEQKKEKYTTWSEEKKEKHKQKGIEFRKNNKDKMREYYKKYNNKKSTKHKMKEYAKENSKELSIYKKEYHLKNRDKHLKAFAKYRRTSEYRFVSRAGFHNNRSKKDGVYGVITKEELFELFEKQEAKCFYCNVELDFNIKRFVHIDHKIPLSKGGSNTIDNIAWCCANCNLKKGDKLAY